MAKYRITSKGSLVTIKSKLALGEQINERELELFNRQLFRGCFRPRVEGKKEIIYTAPDAINICKFLRAPVTDAVFFEIIAQTLEMAKRIEINGLYRENLILDMKMVFICERTKEVFFVYQPIISRLSSGNVYAFLADLTQLAEKNAHGDADFLQKFKVFLENPANYRLEDIELYVRNACPQVYRKVVAADAGKSGFITNDRIAYKMHYQDKDSDNMGTTLLSGDEGTTLLGEDEGTILLTQAPCFPTIWRRKTEKSAKVDKNYFVIGKEAGCDFQISDNKAISRKHAVIENRNGIYYITDKNSTNHTYLNGQMLECEVPYELRDGSVIRIADEEFEFEW